jgi:hypothetical protein
VGYIQLHMEVHLQDNFGRFRAALDAAETAALKEVLAEVEEDAAMFAPYRLGDLAGSIHSRMLSSRHGFVAADADHAMPQEEGAVPHDIPNAFGRGFTVHHPGNPATHFMRDAMRGAADKIAARIGALM